MGPRPGAHFKRVFSNLQKYLNQVHFVWESSCVKLSQQPSLQINNTLVREHLILLVHKI